MSKMVEVTQEDANNYSRILSMLGMEEEGDPVDTIAALVAGAQPAPKQEVHDALCPALTEGKCTCSSSPTTVDKAWSQFCGGIGRGPDAPYPGMIEAFEAHYGQSFTDRDWRNETAVWAAAWQAATVKSSAYAQPAYGALAIVWCPILQSFEYRRLAPESEWDAEPEIPKLFLASKAEINELRAALQERDAEIQRQYACIASHARITQAAEGKVEAQRKVLEQVLNTLIDVTASINMKRFWRDKDGKRFDEITDTAITAIQEQLA